MTRPPHDPDNELEFHIELLTRRYVEEGLDPAAARDKALARMGDLDAVAQERWLIEHRTAALVSGVRWWQGWGQDLQQAWRVLRRSPGFVGLSVAMLALGTGASTAVFSVVDGTILRSPFNDPASIAMVRFTAPSGQLTSAIPTDAYERLSANVPGLVVALGQVKIASPVVTRVDTPRRTQTECVSASMGQVLGTRPLMGRWFGPDEDRPGAAGVAVVSVKFWRGSLGGDPNAIGRTIALDGLPVTVIGVMPAGFDGAFSRPDRDIWVPLGQSTPATPRFDCRPGNGIVNAMARLETGASFEAGAAALNAAAGTTKFALAPMTDLTIADLRDPFNALVGAVLAVLLIAFANVTNLGLERLAGRRQELAIRVALGATRVRIIREAVAEHMVVSLAGAAVGIGIAMVTFDAMMALLPASLPNRDAIALNGRVLSASIALALIGGLCAGVGAAYQASASAIRAGMAAGDRGHTKGSTITRRVLVASELALGVLLLVGALLMIRTFLTLRPSEPGFDPTGKHIALVRLPPETTQADRLSFVSAVSEQLTALPGIRQVAATTSVPMRRSVSVFPAAIGEAKSDIYTGAVTPNYFDMMGVPVRRGRALTAADTADTAPVAVINEAFVQRWFPESQPLGSNITLNPDTNRSATFTVVGVMADTRSFGGDTRIRPFLYVPLAQSILGNSFFMIHADPGVGSALPARVREVVTRLRPGQLVDEVETLMAEMNAEVAQPRLGAWLFGLFAGLAVFLAAVGLAATLAWSVAQRTREIGIRMALGARPADVRALVVGQSLSMAVTGVGAGLLAAGWATRLLAGWLYGVTPLDPTTFAACGAAMIAIALLASWLPTHRASRVDPVVALRGQ